MRKCLYKTQRCLSLHTSFPGRRKIKCDPADAWATLGWWTQPGELVWQVWFFPLQSWLKIRCDSADACFTLGWWTQPGQLVCISFLQLWRRCGKKKQHLHRADLALDRQKAYLTYLFLSLVWGLKLYAAYIEAIRCRYWAAYTTILSIYWAAYTTILKLYAAYIELHILLY